MNLNMIEIESGGYTSPDKLRQMIKNKMSRNTKEGALQSALNKV